MNALALTTVSKLKHSEHSNYWNIRSLQYNSLFLITRPPPLETSASQTSYLHYSRLRNSFTIKLYLKSRGRLCVCTVYCMQRLLSFGASTVYTLFDVQRAEQEDGVLECNRSAKRVREMPSTLKFTRFTQMQWRKCCNNCFDVYKLPMSNDIDHPGCILEHLLW